MFCHRNIQIYIIFFNTIFFFTIVYEGEEYALIVKKYDNIKNK